MSLVANAYIGVLAYRGEERREVRVHIVGWTAKNDTAAVRSRYEVVWRLLLLLLCSPAILPAGNRMYLAYYTSSPISRPPDGSIALPAI